MKNFMNPKHDQCQGDRIKSIRQKVQLRVNFKFVHKDFAEITFLLLTDRWLFDNKPNRTIHAFSLF